MNSIDGSDSAKTEENQTEDYFDELEYSSLRTDGMKGLGSKIFKKTEFLFFLMGAALFILILIFTISSVKTPKSIDGKQLESFDARIKQMEDRLNRIQWHDKKLAQLDMKTKEISPLISKYNQLEMKLASQLTLLERKMSMLEKGSKTTVETNRNIEHKVRKASKKKNSKRYHNIRTGETLYSISRRYGMTIDELCRLNEFPPGKSIYPGQKLIVNNAD